MMRQNKKARPVDSHPTRDEVSAGRDQAFVFEEESASADTVIPIPAAKLTGYFSNKKYFLMIAIPLLVFICSIVAVHTSSHTPFTSEQSAAVIQSQETVLPEHSYYVTRVVDGDTVVVHSDVGGDHTVRLIGVNTPETVDPRKPVQCFGKEASEYLKHMLPADTVVRLETDPTQNDVDKYGRWLRYVYLGDVLVDEEIIQEGYGFEYTYKKPYQFQAEFRSTEKYAREGGIGLWASATCAGKLVPAK